MEKKDEIKYLLLKEQVKQLSYSLYFYIIVSLALAAILTIIVWFLLK